MCALLLYVCVGRLVQYMQTSAFVRMRIPRSITCTCIFLTLKCVGVREHSHRPPGLSLGANRAVLLKNSLLFLWQSLTGRFDCIASFLLLLLHSYSSPSICSVPLFPTLISFSLPPLFLPFLYLIRQGVWN